MLGYCDWDGVNDADKIGKTVVKTSWPYRLSSRVDGSLQSIANYWIGYVQEYIPYFGPRKNRASLIKSGYPYRHNLEITSKNVLNDPTCFA